MGAAGVIPPPQPERGKVKETQGGAGKTPAPPFAILEGATNPGSESDAIPR
jgi:hypothetical protein